MAMGTGREGQIEAATDTGRHPPRLNPRFSKNGSRINKDRKGKIFTDQWMLVLQACKSQERTADGGRNWAQSLARTDLGLMVRFSKPRSEFPQVVPLP